MTVLPHWFGCSDSDRNNLRLINEHHINTDSLSFGHKIVTNWENVQPHYLGTPNNSRRGQFMELIICSAIIEAGVQPHKVRRNVKFSPGDIDILVLDCAIGSFHGIASKVSSRERWAIADRDAAILADPRYAAKIQSATNGINGKDITSWYLCWKENAETPVHKAIDHARKFDPKCAYIKPGHCMSILDKERMQNLIYHITGVTQ
jgi:hypothetical protein